MLLRSRLWLERGTAAARQSLRSHATTSRRRRRPSSKKSTVVRTESTSNPTLSEPSIYQPIAWYSRKLDTHPLLTKCISSGLVAGSGEVLGQYIQYRKQSPQSRWNWDMARTGRFVILGFVLVAPVCHVWYGSLMERIPGNGVKQIVTRVFLDQFVFAPLFLPTWLLNLWMLEGKSVDYVAEEMPIKVPIVVANWALWIPAQTINLGFVPSKYQVLFSNIVAVSWNTYLTLITHENAEDLNEDV